MFYLAQATADTGAVILRYTNLFNTKDQAKAYASELILNNRLGSGYDYVEVTALEVEDD